ncbi:MAG: glycosyltransferase, partial [Pseudomonadota bacterium]|nr:glycosyltransferase [Pseudomonadota bacterium]
MGAADERVAGPRIAVILTCFNRRQKTLACLDAVLAQTALNNMALDFFITDDGSVDGTADALLDKNARIRLFKGNGTLYWNGGMRLAWAEALRGTYDFFLWLNDDTFLYPETLQRLVDTHHAQCGIGSDSNSNSNSNSDSHSHSHSHSHSNSYSYSYSYGNSYSDRYRNS